MKLFNVNSPIHLWFILKLMIFFSKLLKNNNFAINFYVMILILYIGIVMKNSHLILFILFISSLIVIVTFFDRQVVWF